MCFSQSYRYFFEGNNWFWFKPALHVPRKHKHKHKRMEIVPFSCACACACAYACVVRVNRDDASISTSSSTRRLCLRRTGLHVGFLCLCLCLGRTCKPGFRIEQQSLHGYSTVYKVTCNKTCRDRAIKNNLPF